MERHRLRKFSGIIDFIKTQAIAIFLFIAVAGSILTGISQTADSRDRQELQMAEDSIRRAVVSCYAIEGRYPENYDYLVKNYGLIVDEDKYIVHYEIFASNIMPEITLTRITE